MPAPLEDDFLENATIAIIGLGLMGGSLALALRGKCMQRIGYDADPAAVALAMEKNMIDKPVSLSSGCLDEADVIILAAPILAILQLLDRLPVYHTKTAIVIDIGSTKKEIVEMMNTLPNRFLPLGGHPMCGKEKHGLTHADANLFTDMPFFFCPTNVDPGQQREIAAALCRAVGANPVWVDAHEHDHFVAATSHLPYLVSNTLAAVTPRDAAPFISSGFNSTTRLAASSIPMMIDILKSNRQNILRAMQRYKETFDVLVDCLEHEQFTRLKSELQKGAGIKSFMADEQGKNI